MTGATIKSNEMHEHVNYDIFTFVVLAVILAITRVVPASTYQFPAMKIYQSPAPLLVYGYILYEIFNGLSNRYCEIRNISCVDDSNGLTVDEVFDLVRNIILLILIVMTIVQPTSSLYHTIARYMVIPVVYWIIFMYIFGLLF